jgi:hypothetical protein
MEGKTSPLFDIVDERKRNAGGGVLAEPSSEGSQQNANVLCFREPK